MKIILFLFCKYQGTNLIYFGWSYIAMKESHTHMFSSFQLALIIKRVSVCVYTSISVSIPICPFLFLLCENGFCECVRVWCMSVWKCDRGSVWVWICVHVKENKSESEIELWRVVFRSSIDSRYIRNIVHFQVRFRNIFPITLLKRQHIKAIFIHVKFSKFVKNFSPS